MQPRCLPSAPSLLEPAASCPHARAILYACQRWRAGEMVEGQCGARYPYLCAANCPLHHNPDAHEALLKSLLAAYNISWLEGVSGPLHR